MAKDKRSFFERLTGAQLDSEEHERKIPVKGEKSKTPSKAEWISVPSENEEEGELTVDVYQTPNDIIIKTITAGVKPDDLDISISRDMVTIRGHREESHEVSEEDYYSRELYWGSFSRTVLLPQEVDVDGAEAIEKHGLLTLKLPKLDKRRETKLKVKTS